MLDASAMMEAASLALPSLDDPSLFSSSLGSLGAQDLNSTLQELSADNGFDMGAFGERSLSLPASQDVCAPAADEAAAPQANGSTTLKGPKGERRCMQCGATGTETPRFRSGPTGPLCNACGLQWRAKKRNSQKAGVKRKAGDWPVSLTIEVPLANAADLVQIVEYWALSTGIETSTALNQGEAEAE